MKLLSLIVLLTVSLAVNASDWMYRTSSNLTDLDSQKWIRFPKEKKPIPREFEGYIEYKTLLPKESLNTGNAFYFGKIGDTDRTYLNGVQIGQTGNFPPHFSYNMDTERIYFLPAFSTLKEINELKILVYSKFLVNKGFNPANFQIGSASNLDGLKYQNELANNLSKFIIPILCLVLAVVSFPLLAPKHLWNSQLMIFLIGLSSFMLGLCRGRIPYHFYDMLVIYKLTLTSSILTIWLVCIFMTRKCRSEIRFFPTIVAIALITWIILSNNLVGAAGVGRIWFHISPMFLLLALYGNLKTSSLLSFRSIGLITLILTNINDNLNDLRFISTTSLLQYGLGIFISLMIIDQLHRLKKSWERYFMKEAQLEIDAELGRQALQIAHDLRSPIDAIRESLGRINHIPEHDQYSLDLGLSRINEICVSLLKRNTNNEALIGFNELATEIKSLVAEVKSKHQNNPNIKITFHSEGETATNFAKLDPARLKRAVCNLVNNAIEATQLSGEVSVLMSTREGHIEICVEDNGCGISVNSEKLFDRGFTTKTNGYGLGLSGTKEFVEAIGGSVSIENLKRGTKVTLTIPYAFSAGSEAEVKSSIVLIDDDALVRFNWKRQGETKGVHVHTFENFDSFLTLAESFPLDIPIFIDSNLGEEKGELLSEKLRKQGFKSVYLTTGLPKEAIQTTSWISDIVSKSFDSAVLPRLHSMIIK